MADYKATTSEFQAVANAIRTKGGTSAQLEWPTGFANAVAALPSGATLGAKTITENGTYNASSDNFDGYSQVEVNVSGGGSGDLYVHKVTFQMANNAKTIIINNSSTALTFQEILDFLYKNDFTRNTKLYPCLDATSGSYNNGIYVNYGNSSLIFRAHSGGENGYNVMTLSDTVTPYVT